jgi:hypothetical protein
MPFLWNFILRSIGMGSYGVDTAILKEVIRVLLYNHKNQVNGRTTREAARAGAQGTKTDAAGKSELPPASDVSSRLHPTFLFLAR